MRCGDRWVNSAVAILAVGLFAWSPTADAQETEVTGHLVTMSSDGSTLQFELANGGRVAIRFANGTLFIDDNNVASFDAGSPVARGWQQIVSQAGRLSSDELLAAILEWDATAYDREGANAVRQIAERVSDLHVATSNMHAAEAEAAEETAVAAAARANEVRARAAAVAERAEQVSLRIQQIDELRQLRDLGIHGENTQLRRGDLTIPRGTEIENDLIVVGGDVSVFGSVHGTLVATDGDVILHRGGHVAGDIVTVNGSVTRAGGRVDGQIRSSDGVTRRSGYRQPRIMVEQFNQVADPGTSMASILGMFIALACIGFGFTFFAPRQLEVVSETVTESFGKSFLAGLFTTPLVIPAFAMLLVGLAITVVGILLIPFAILGGIAAIIAAAVGGYLAVAKSVGSTVLTKRMAQGHATTVTPYKSLVIGLLMLMAIWLPAAVLGWIPILGQLFAFLALAFSWVMVTAGVGAAVLSRAGLRATFVSGRRRHALTDEYYWPDAELHQSLPRSTDRV